jgi:hypothetical protein
MVLKKRKARNVQKTAPDFYDCSRDNLNFVVFVYKTHALIQVGLRETYAFFVADFLCRLRGYRCRGVPLYEY